MPRRLPLPEGTLPRLLIVAAGAWFAFWACAPPSTLPAPVPMAKGDGIALGGGVVGGVITEQCVDAETGRTDTCSRSSSPALDLQHWGMGAVSDRWALGWAVAGGSSVPGIAGGGMVRFDALGSQRAFLGPQVEGGFGWWAVGLPASLQVSDTLWLYTHPSYGSRFNGSLRAPVGVGVSLRPTLRLDIEAGYAYAVPVPGIDVGPFSNLHRPWIGIGLTGTVGGH